MSNGYSSQGDPDDVVNFRGGSWVFVSKWCRSACRYKDEPANRYQYSWLRLVLRKIGRVRDHGWKKNRE